MPIAKKFLRRKQGPKPKKPEGKPVEVVRSIMKPSDRARLTASEEVIKTGNASLRPLIVAEGAFMYRIFKRTLQPVECKSTSLSSWAAFVLVCDADREAVGWFGDACSTEDRFMAAELGLQVMRLDLRRYGVTTFPFATEGNENLKALRYMLSKLWSDENTYRSKQICNLRKRAIANVPVSLGIVEKNVDGSLSVRDVALASPDVDGEVPRLAFVSIEIDTIAVLNHGIQWDLWVSRGARAADEANAKAFVSRLAVSRAPSSTSFDSIISNQYLRVVKQGCERILFRQHFKFITDFEPEGKCVPWAPPEIPKALPKMQLPAGLGEVLDPFVASGAIADGAMAAGGALADFFASSLSLRAEASPQTAVLPVRERSPWAIAVEQQKLRAGQYMVPGSNLRRQPPVPGVEKHLPYMPYRVDNISLLSRQSRAAGRDMLSENMMRLLDVHNVSPEVSAFTVGQSTLKPSILLGWQIEVDEGAYRGRFVVTGMRKTVFQKSQFRLSNDEGDDLWVKLKRGAKNGVRFRVLRKVVEFQAPPAPTTAPGARTAGGKSLLSTSDFDEPLEALTPSVFSSIASPPPPVAYPVSTSALVH